LAFAANSLLCRLALQHASIDPASFGSVRLVSGALMLALIVRVRSGHPLAAAPDWLAATMLFAYVAFFSFAYLTLSAGTGALLARDAHASAAGLALAVASGAVTSGIGYVVWYAALAGLTAMRAATVQLSVPPIAAFGGVLLLAEPISLRLGVASAAILGGIA